MTVTEWLLLAKRDIEEGQYERAIQYINEVIELLEEET